MFLGSISSRRASVGRMVGLQDSDRVSDTERRQEAKETEEGAGGWSQQHKISVFSRNTRRYSENHSNTPEVSYSKIYVIRLESKVLKHTHAHPTIKKPFTLQSPLHYVSHGFKSN